MPIFAEQAEAVQKPVLHSQLQDRRTETSNRVVPNNHAESILRLQRTIGNRAVQRLLDRRTEDQRDTRLGVSLDSRPPSAIDGRGDIGDGPDPVDQRDAGDTLIQRDDGGDLGSPDGGAVPASAAPPVARPKPIAVRNGPSHAPIDTDDSAGMSIAITITSSSGVDADMAAIQDSEKVDPSENHKGSMVGLDPMASNNSGFMAGYPIPDDHHAWGKAFFLDRWDNHGGAGSFEKHQLDIYTDAAGGVTTPTAIPNSGYIITRESIASGTSIKLKTSKRAANVNVAGFASSAGPSPEQSETVTLRA